MAAGLAKEIKTVYPEVYTIYRNWFENNYLSLGQLCCVPINNPNNSLWIANLCGQYNYGRSGCYTSYDALTVALQALANFISQRYILRDLPVYIPYNMGCGLAGGDWSRVKQIISEKIPEAIIVRLPKKGLNLCLLQ